MGVAYGAKQRHIERCKYNPQGDASRKTRVISKSGHVQTYKRKGDKIIDPSGNAWRVDSDGWH